MGMSQLDHHREVRGCELEETRGKSFVSILECPTKTAPSAERVGHLVSLGIPTGILGQMGIH